MGKKGKFSAYHDGEIVIVDLGKNYYFGEVISSKPKQVGCNDSFEYEIKGLTNPVEEYYIRRADPEDLELKELHSKLKIDNFKIDDDRIKRVFWRGQKNIIDKATNFINSFLYPYLKIKKHVIEVDKMNDWNSNYKTGMHTKDEYVFIIPHDMFNIVVQKSSTYVSLFITLPNNLPNNLENKSILCVICMAVKYSDEEYTNNFIKVTKEIISQLEKGKKQDYYNLWIKSDYTDSLEMYKEVLLPKESYNRMQEALPGYEYTRFLSDLSCLKHYFFSSNFTLKDK